MTADEQGQTAQTDELSQSEREILYDPDRRLSGYYFSFDSKWGRWGEGRSCIDVVQAAANDAAKRSLPPASTPEEGQR